ncbi:hypothetical protein F5Y04DRAFT_282948 [Hypomontagnella monticulosa]|nr:hypothetical protein F5Y04DRAFT_282948 [Hypomontagnella monticulosa]
MTQFKIINALWNKVVPKAKDPEHWHKNTSSNTEFKDGNRNMFRRLVLNPHPSPSPTYTMYVMRDADPANGSRLRIREQVRPHNDSVTKKLCEKANGIRKDVFGSDRKSIDSSTTRTRSTTTPSCPALCSDSSLSINSEASRENAASSFSPTTSTSSEIEFTELNTQPSKPPKPVPKKGRTFPLSRRERRSIDEIINKTGGLVLDSTPLFANPEQLAVLHQKLGSRESLLAKMSNQRSSDSRRFVRIWEHYLLPALEQILQEHGVKGFTIAVRRGREAGHRVIELMTESAVSDDVRKLFEEAKDEYLDGDARGKTSVRFRLGRVEYLADNPEPEPPSPTSTRSSDSWHPPVNVRRYTNPVMGDSVGPNSAGGGSATLGPLLQIAQKFYRILNWHIFDDEGNNLHWSQRTPPILEACHPSLDDSSGQSLPIGQTVAYSGPMHVTSRVSRSIQRAHFAALGAISGPVRTVTDWVLVETTTGPQVNRVRKVDMPRPRCDSFSENITQIADPVLGDQNMVYSTGRSSGYSFGQICEVLGTTWLGDVRTRNWGIETPNHVPDEDWNRGGMGIPGDSGAPVIDKRTNSLLGQIWGRNKYRTQPDECPITWFTAMSDIYDDIQERMPNSGTPSLPNDASLMLDAARSTSPTPILPSPASSPIVNDAGRRSTLTSISENEDEVSSSAPMPGTPNHRRSVARTTVAARLSGHGASMPGLEPIRRLTMIAHAATF